MQTSEMFYQLPMMPFLLVSILHVHFSYFSAWFSWQIEIKTLIYSVYDSTVGDWHAIKNSFVFPVIKMQYQFHLSIQINSRSRVALKWEYWTGNKKGANLSPIITVLLRSSIPHAKYGIGLQILSSSTSCSSYVRPDCFDINFEFQKSNFTE